MIYLIILTIYLLSAFTVYKWMQKAFYHKNGVFKNTKPDYINLFITFVPIINTIMAVLGLTFLPATNKSTNFFKPKNYDKNP